MKKTVSLIYEISLDGTPLWPEKEDYTITKSGINVLVTLHDKWVTKGFKEFRVDESNRTKESIICINLYATEPMHLKYISFKI